jgi:hypothetical protein
MKKPASLTRRRFLKTSALASAAAALPLVPKLNALPVPANPKPVPSAPPAAKPSATASLRWLDDAPPQISTGATWGVPWARGIHKADTQFKLGDIPLQTWPLATWPDGSLKWTAHAIPADTFPTGAQELTAGAPASPAKPLRATTTAESIEIDTGVITARIARAGTTLITSVKRTGTGDDIIRDGKLVCLLQNAPSSPDTNPAVEPFTGRIGSVTLEQNGPVRAVVKIEGKHTLLCKLGMTIMGEPRSWLPFVLRLYFHAGAESFRVMHTIIYDGDENRDFIRGLGLRFSVPMRGELHDRHIRFAGETGGLFGEAVRGITGLRRDPGEKIRAAQIAGTLIGPASGMGKRIADNLTYIAAFSDWTLFQQSADGFEIRKRTREGFSWLESAQGGRARGLGYAGTPAGGAAFGIRNFWQSHPAQLDIRGAATDTAEVTAWLWAPDAPAMDLRFYHDGMGEDTHEKQVTAMDINYEDYEPGFGKPEGVARTSELHIWALAATPSRERLVALADAVAAPAVLTCRPAHILGAGVFGSLWSLPDRTTPARAAIEDHLDYYFDFYRRQAGERRWYGFWNYGDVMHTYDSDRHEWRYDVGGFAWDNSELSTDIWLWLHYLRTGSPAAFRFAEAMTRHTGEVDVHHAGRFAPLGSRHNVMHWGCSAKQLRISTAQNRRYYYYLTGDERTGDLLREQVEAVRALLTIQPGRKYASRRPGAQTAQTATNVNVGFGTDWGSVAAAWLTEWERTGDARVRDRLLAGMRTIGAQPHGFFTSGARFNIETGEFTTAAGGRVSASHLSAVFGLAEVCAELIALTAGDNNSGAPAHAAFAKAWLQYCELYNATPAEQERALGRPLGSLNLAQGHARLTAYAAKMTGNAGLAARAWQEFEHGGGGLRRAAWDKGTRIDGPAVTRPVEENAAISTNAVAQWALAAIECLALAGDHLPAG